MNFWSLNTRFYLKTMNFWKTDLTMFLDSFLRETPIWNNGCKSDELLVSLNKTVFYLTDVKAKPMVSWWETPIWNNGCKSDVLLVSKDSFLPYDWKTDGFLMRNHPILNNFWSLNTHFYLTMENWWETPIWNKDVKAMNFWSLNTRFTLRLKTDGFLMRNSNLKQRM